MLNNDMLKQLEYELSNVKPSFRHSKLYKLLKVKLTDLGYWKAKERGNPSKGFKAMVDAINEHNDYT